MDNSQGVSLMISLRNHYRTLLRTMAAQPNLATPDELMTGAWCIKYPDKNGLDASGINHSLGEEGSEQWVT